MEEQKRICIDSAVYDERKMDAWLAEVGERIRMERMRQNLSISKLAELSNLSPSCISKAESNQCGISLKALLKIAVALGMPVWELLEQEKTDGEPEKLLEKMGEEEKTSFESRRFEDIIATAESDTIEFILDMAEQLMKVVGREKD